MNKTLTEHINALAKETMTVKGGEIPLVVALAKTIWQKAIQGDKACIQILYDRLEGRVPVAQTPPSKPQTLDEDIINAVERAYG